MTTTFDWNFRNKAFPCEQEIIQYAVTAQREKLIGIYYLLEDKKVS
jgi:hypothetical protein